MNEKAILLYTLSTCSHCKATKKLLSEYNFEYTDIIVDILEGEERKENINELKELNPRCSFPTIKINDTVIVGYRKNEIMAALEVTND